MSKTRRPPEILRKSHAHLEHEERSRRKRELLDALDEAADDGGEPGLDASGGEGDGLDDAVAGRGRPTADDEDDS